MEAAEEPSSGLKREIKTEDLDAEEGDAWLAASCFEEEEEGEDKVKMEVEESVKMEVEEEEAKDSVERPKKLEELRSCKVVLRDCIHIRGKRHSYGTAAKWLLQNGSIMVREDPGNFCQFFCSQCKETFPSRSSIQNHRRKTGGCSVPSQLSKACAHVCNICSRILLNDTTYLNKHYTRKHGVYYTTQVGCVGVQYPVDYWQNRETEFLKGCPLWWWEISVPFGAKAATEPLLH